MSRDPSIGKVILVTVERGGSPTVPGVDSIPGIEHRTISMRFNWWGLLSKVDLFVRAPLILSLWVWLFRIDILDAKAALAGGIAYITHRITGVSYIVESFEPHSEYMADCGIWKRDSIYYRFSRWLELEQRRTAQTLITVTWNYHEFLVRQGVHAERVKVIPSITDLGQFAFDAEARARVRSSMGWEDTVVGIYVGKFGGLYYDEEAFAIFRSTMDRFGERFRLVLLTMENEKHVHERLEAAGIPRDRVMVRFAQHHEVPDWLSASDIAFSTIRYAPNGLYQSPVKNGEYWANGLPILLTYGVSDDHRLILERPWAGALFDLSVDGSLEKAIEHMAVLTEKGVERMKLMNLAREHRSIEIAQKVYREIFGRVSA
jgi:glycosyltransferase involved in cell wall biosynthesis